MYENFEEGYTTTAGFIPAEELRLRGPKGEKGDKGDTGSTGAKGDTGDKGDKGDAFTYEDFTEEQLQGLKGPKGDKGDTGDKGDKGDTGDKGDKGDTGDQGIQGEKGDTGEQGEKGDKGDKGDTGDTGETGESAYDAAVEAGYEGTEEEFAASMANVANKISNTEKGVANGVATLDENGKVPSAQLPSVGGWRREVFDLKEMFRGMTTDEICLNGEEVYNLTATVVDSEECRHIKRIKIYDENENVVESRIETKADNAGRSFLVEIKDENGNALQMEKGDAIDCLFRYRNYEGDFSDIIGENITSINLEKICSTPSLVYATGGIMAWKSGKTAYMKLIITCIRDFVFAMDEASKSRPRIITR